MSDTSRLDDLKAYIRAQRWLWQPGKPIAYGEQIIVLAGSDTASVNFYPKNGKLVTGGAKSPLKDALDAWIAGDIEPPEDVAKDETEPVEAMLPGSRLDELKRFIQQQGWQWRPGAVIPYGEQIIVVSGGQSARVNFWTRRGKLQVQAADSPLKTALQAWISGGVAPDEAAAALAGPHIGMDESGKGDWFGPLVVAAVYADLATMARLHRLGVRDSKELDGTAIGRLAAEIERVVPPEARHVWTIAPGEYNERYARHNNINLLLAEAYARVARQVWDATQVPAIICDQFAQNADRLEQAFTAAGLPRPVQRHRAESASIAVAAASILASAAFAEAMEALGREAGLNGSLPKGASDIEALEAAARHILGRGGAAALGRYAKLNFKPVKVLLGEATTTEAQQETSAARSGPPVAIPTFAWQVEQKPGGFWRYTFADGGYLDWWPNSARGTIYVHGKPEAESVRILKPKTVGKTWHGAREKLDQAIEKYVPRLGQRQVSSVLGVGWQRRDTVFGARFDFTDGAVLLFYRCKDQLKDKWLLQGTPSELTRTAFAALPNPFWGGLDRLTDVLKQLFPDWRLGDAMRPNEREIVTAGPGATPAEPGLNWMLLWPEGKELRTAANGAAPCQRAMADDWAAVLGGRNGKSHLLAHAPTGLGKTLAALAPALAWVAEAPDRRRIYYLVNRVAQHENPLRELRDGLAARFEGRAGQPLRVVDIVSRELLCDHPHARTLAPTCRAARDQADFVALPAGVPGWHEVKAALSGRTCPYHTLQGLMARAHLVVCDYWWLFSPMAQELGLSEQVGFSPTNSIIIVDEAHNLIPRVRCWLDVDETPDRLDEATRHTSPKARACLEPILNTLAQAAIGECLAPSALVGRAGGENAIRAALTEVTSARQPDVAADAPERIMRLLLQPDDAVAIYPAEDSESGGRRLAFRLVDPIPILQAGYGRVHASLSMSGTLAAPADNDDELRYQAAIFSLPLERTMTRKYASPFPLRNQRWIYCPDTLGIYRERNAHTRRYVEHITGVGQATPGVTAVFFSSYGFLEQVRDAMPPSERSLIVAEARADAQGADVLSDLGAYETRLRQLVADHGRAYLFGVYQGKLAEGADFRGNLLKTIVCVSIPLEYPALFHQRLEALYASRFAEIAEAMGDDARAKAREYARDRLSLSLVLQACGRGIRNEADRCVFVLLDQRYHEYGWRRFLDPRPYNLRQPAGNAADFHRERAGMTGPAWDPALLEHTQGEKPR
jgi:ribonuclease HIII